MKLYTLQECFEQAGSKFPFTVDWVNEFDQDRVIFNINIIHEDQGHWFWDSSIENFGVDLLTGFWGIAQASEFSLSKRRIYNKDFEDLIK